MTWPTPAPGLWTQEHMDLLKALWLEGLSCAKTAAKLNATFKTSYSRNAIIGKVHRMGMSGRHMPSAPARATAGLAFKPGKPKRNPERRSFVAFKPPEPLPAEIEPAKDARPWLERKFGECAAPVAGEGADTLSCCRPSGAHRYCKAHREIFYRPNPADQAKRDNSLAQYITRRAA